MNENKKINAKFYFEDSWVQHNYSNKIRECFGEEVYTFFCEGIVSLLNWCQGYEIKRKREIKVDQSKVSDIYFNMV